MSPIAAHEARMPGGDPLARLLDLELPALQLYFVRGVRRDVACVAREEGPLVIYFFPGIAGREGALHIADLEDAQASDFRDYEAEFGALGYRLLGIATQPVSELLRWARSQQICHALASDRELKLARALDLPTVRVGQRTMYERVTLVVGDGRIRRVFYPVPQPDHAAVDVLSALYLESTGRGPDTLGLKRPSRRARTPRRSA